MQDGSYDVCQNCYRKHVNKHTCSGCGESKPVKAKCDQKEPWMRKGAQMRDGSYDVCPKCYRKHMNMHTCSGCGESKPVTVKYDQKESWMRKGAQMLGDPCPRNVKKLRLIHRGIGVKKRFVVKARDAVYRRPAASVPSRKRPAAAAFCSKRQVAACSGKVTREYKSCDNVQ